MLTEARFCKAAEDLGFGGQGEALFEELPLREDRTVRWPDIMGTIAARDASEAMKLFLVAMACPPTVALKRAVKRRVWR